MKKLSSEFSSARSAVICFTIVRSDCDIPTLPRVMLEGVSLRSGALSTVFFPIKDTPPPRGPKFFFRTPPP